MTEIVPSNTQTMLDAWMEAERNGDRFPIPFDVAYKMAGYSRKDSAKRALVAKTIEDTDFHTIVERVKLDQGGFALKESISLSCDGLKHLCMMSNTPTGRATRMYFIECEKKWRTVQAIAPEVAQEAEMLTLKREVLALEMQLIQKREYIATALPEPMQQKILGYQTIERVEYVDRTITPDGDRLDGVGIMYLQRRYGFKSTKQTWEWLESVGYGKDSGKWHLELSARESSKLTRQQMRELDELADRGTRQQWLGE